MTTAAAPARQALTRAVLAIESGTQSEDSGRQGVNSVTLHRPKGTYLQNDGRMPYWMDPDSPYTLTRDEQGWVVTCHSWPSDGHTFRLARDGELVGSVYGVSGGLVPLDPARTYQISRAQSHWMLYELVSVV